MNTNYYIYISSHDIWGDFEIQCCHIVVDGKLDIDVLKQYMLEMLYRIGDTIYDTHIQTKLSTMIYNIQNISNQPLDQSHIHTLTQIFKFVSNQHRILDDNGNEHEFSKIITYIETNTK